MKPDNVKPAEQYRGVDIDADRIEKGKVTEKEVAADTKELNNNPRNSEVHEPK